MPLSNLQEPSISQLLAKLASIKGDGAIKFPLIHPSLRRLNKSKNLVLVLKPLFLLLHESCLLRWFWSKMEKWNGVISNNYLHTVKHNKDRLTLHFKYITYQERNNMLTTRWFGYHLVVVGGYALSKYTGSIKTQLGQISLRFERKIRKSCCNQQINNINDSDRLIDTSNQKAHLGVSMDGCFIPVNNQSQIVSILQNLLLHLPHQCPAIVLYSLWFRGL